MATVNTNPGAAIALQNLNSTNSQLSEVQSRINTGLKVSSAKDNGGVFAIAQGLRSEVSALGAVTDSLDRGISTLDVAIAAGEAVSDLLTELKSKALAATDASLDTASRNALNEDFTALRDQITNIVGAAEFNGVNLINNTTNGFDALSDASGGTITVADQDLTLSGGVVTLTTTSQINTETNATATLALVEASIDNVGSALATLGTNAKALEVHNNFVGKLSDSLETGIGNLVDADLAKESARLQSLQVKQQLGVQALSIANSAPGTVLSLFR